MIELRWLVNNDNSRRLQYRQKVDTTTYAGLGPFPDSMKNMQWSTWADVPEVQSPPLAFSNKCSKCGLVLEGSMGYVCIQNDCPAGLGYTIP